eukprot:evm.model.scf_2097.1 EVM.evm.TU.scf_2097.1   scf_2097:422-3400(-)
MAGSIVQVKSYNVYKVEGEMKLIVSDLEVLSKQAKENGQGTNTPGSLALDGAVEVPGLEQAPRPPRALPASFRNSRKLAGSLEQPVLNPIQTMKSEAREGSIRAMVQRKLPKNSFSPHGKPVSIFSVDLIDEQGKQVEGTFWGRMADKYYSTLEEGK